MLVVAGAFLAVTATSLLQLPFPLAIAFIVLMAIAYRRNQASGNLHLQTT